MNKKYKEYMDGLIESILPTFMENIPEEDREQLSKAFIEKMRTDYSDVISDAVSNTNASLKMIISIFSDPEINIWSNMVLDRKKSILLYDDNFQKLISLSLNTFEKAKQRAKHNTLIEMQQYQNTFDEMENLLRKIQPYNITAAQQVYSEALVDLNYACGLSNNKSLRLARYY